MATSSPPTSAETTSRSRRRPPLLQPIGPMLRRARTERAMLGTLFAIILVTAFIAAAVPRLLNDMADRGLAHAVTSANVFQRNIQLLRTDDIRPANEGDIYAPIDAYGAEFQETLAPSIQDIIGDRTWTLATLRSTMVEKQPADTFPFARHITLLYQNRIDDQITYVAGRAPAATDETIVPSNEEIQTLTGSLPVIEVAFAAEAAETTDLALNDVLLMMPNEDEPLANALPEDQRMGIAIRIVGLFTINDPDAEYWVGDIQLHRAIEYDDGMVVQYYATALMGPEGYDVLRASTPYPFRYTWRYMVDAERMDAGELGTLAADVRRLDAEYGTASSSRVGEDAVRTGLSQIFRGYLAQRRLAEAVLALAASGLAGVALAVIALISQFIAERRRAATMLIRGRGASTRQVAVAQVAEGLLIGLPAAAIGYLLAILLIGGRAARWSLLGALLVVAGATLLLVLAHLPHARTALIIPVRGDTAYRRIGLQRLVIEVMVVILAIAGAVMLRRRGLSADSATTDQVGFDPYLAAVPLLIGLAVGVVALRMYPLPVRLLAWATALRRDLVPVLGFRRVSRQAGSANLPLLVLLLAVAVGVFSSIMLTSIDRGQTASAWQRVGADYRIEVDPNGALPFDFNLEGVDGVSTAMVMVRPSVPFAARATGSGTALLIGAEARELQEVNGGTEGDPHFTEAMLALPNGTDLGRPTNPIPAIVSSRLPNTDLQPGDTVALTLSGRETYFSVQDVRDTFPSVDPEARWIVVSHEHLVAAAPTRPFRFNLAFVSGGANLLDDINARVDEQSGAARVTSRWVEYAEVRDAPLISGVANGFRVGLAIAAAYSALAIIISLTISAAARARDTAFLRTMGVSSDQVVWLTVAEQTPIVVVALVAGVGLGILVVRLIEPGIDLTAFTGPGIPVSIEVNWLLTGALCIGVVIVVAAAIAATSYAERRAQLGRALRLGDE